MSLPVAMAVGSMVVGAVGAYQQSVATKNAYEYQAQVANNNAQIARWQAEDSIRRGQSEEANYRLKVGQMAGSQRASMAARGLDLSSGSPLDILTSTDFMGEVDALTVRDNAAREAWGFTNQATNAQAEAGLNRYRADQESPLMAAGTSLLGNPNTGRVADKWQTHRNTTGSWF